MARIEDAEDTACRLPWQILSLSVEEAQALICVLSAQIAKTSIPIGMSPTLSVTDESHRSSRLSICVDDGK